MTVRKRKEAEEEDGEEEEHWRLRFDDNPGFPAMAHRSEAPRTAICVLIGSMDQLCGPRRAVDARGGSGLAEVRRAARRARRQQRRKQRFVAENVSRFALVLRVIAHKKPARHLDWA
jgi:hypothetical protein